MSPVFASGLYALIEQEREKEPNLKAAAVKGQITVLFRLV